MGENLLCVEVAVLFSAIGVLTGIALGMAYDMTVMEEIRRTNG